MESFFEELAIYFGLLSYADIHNSKIYVIWINVSSEEEEDDMEESDDDAKNMTV